MYVLTPSSCPGVVVVEELSVWLLMGPTCFQCARARLAPARARSVASRPFSHSKSHPDRSLFCLHPAPSAQPPSCAFRPLSPDPFSPSPSSSRTQKQTHDNSGSNSVSSVSTRPTQPATEIAFSARSQTNCMAPSLVISRYARTSVIGFSHTASATPPSLMTNAAWTFTFPSCVNKVRPHLCSIISFSAHTGLRILSHLWRSSRTLRVRAYEEVQRQGHPARSRLSYRVGCRLGCRSRRGSEGNSHFVVVIICGYGPDRKGAHHERSVQASCTA